ncbi:unnamed protein product [Amoebophrya sp. A120]|nr:unnamed protein product [Amoebophrya sp. A120]|eukprot:GSA120T00022264001.1
MVREDRPLFCEYCDEVELHSNSVCHYLYCECRHTEDGAWDYLCNGCYEELTDMKCTFCNSFAWRDSLERDCCIHCEALVDLTNLCPMGEGCPLVSEIRDLTMGDGHEVEHICFIHADRYGFFRGRHADLIDECTGEHECLDKFEKCGHPRCCLVEDEENPEDTVCGVCAHLEWENEKTRKSAEKGRERARQTHEEDNKEDDDDGRIVLEVAKSSKVAEIGDTTNAALHAETKRGIDESDRLTLLAEDEEGATDDTSTLKRQKIEQRK